MANIVKSPPPTSFNVLLPWNLHISIYWFTAQISLITFGLKSWGHAHGPSKVWSSSYLRIQLTCSIVYLWRCWPSHIRNTASGWLLIRPGHDISKTILRQRHLHLLGSLKTFHPSLQMTGGTLRCFIRIIWYNWTRTKDTIWMKGLQVQLSHVPWFNLWGSQPFKSWFIQKTSWNKNNCTLRDSWRCFLQVASSDLKTYYGRLNKIMFDIMLASTR